MVKSANLFVSINPVSGVNESVQILSQFKLQFQFLKCGLHNSMPKVGLCFVCWSRIHLSRASVVPEPNIF